MTRMEEFQALQQELAQTPPALEGAVERARERTKKRLWKRRVFGVPIASVAALFAVFVALVNVYVPFAYACSSVPGLKALVQAVALNPSLQAALKNDYRQDVGAYRTVGDITVWVDTVVVDQKQLTVFYRIESDVYTEFLPSISFLNADGSDLQNYVSSGGGNPHAGEIQTATLDFPGEETVPQQMQFRISISNANREDPTIWEGDWDTLDSEKYTFSFDLTLDEENILRGESYELNQWITLDGQRIYLESAEIYPSHIRIHLRDDENNTAWLTGLNFCLRNENGKKTESILNGITASGSDTPFMSTLWQNSPFFWESEQLTLEINGVTWLDKDRQYTRFDIPNGKALDPLPEGVSLGGIYRKGRDVYVALTAPQREPYDDTHINTFQLCRTIYYAPDGTEYYLNGMSSGLIGIEQPNGTYQELPEGQFSEQFTLENYPDDMVRLEWLFTRTTTFDTPIEVPIK